MTEQAYQETKKAYLDIITRMMTDTGGMSPHIAVFGVHTDDSLEITEGIIHIEIPNEFMNSNTGKSLFMDQMIPQIASKVRKLIIPHGIAWTSEAYLRTGSEDYKQENWKDIPIEKEVLLVNMEFDHITEILMYEIIRDGHQVTETGNLVDHIELREMTGIKSPEMVSGRLAGLYEKFKTAD